MNTQTMIPNDNWLTETVSNNGAMQSASNSLNMMQYSQGSTTELIMGQHSYTYWPYYQPYYPTVLHTTTPARPIKLLLSEVERLRKAAKADDKLKAILQKFTDQIEITVDFS